MTADPAKLIQILLFMLSSGVILVIALRAYVAERKIENAQEAKPPGDELCPHCGQTVPPESASSCRSAQNDYAVGPENIIRPTAWSGHKDGKPQGFLLRLFGLERAQRAKKAP
jgi:hypothetical protein